MQIDASGGRSLQCDKGNKGVDGRMRALLSLLILSLLAGCSAGPAARNYSEAYSGGKNRVYVVSHGLHTGFVVPAGSIYGALPALKQRFGATPYIEFGWGDREYYQAKEVTSGMTLKAVFWPTGSVIHAVAVPANVSAYFPDSDVRVLCLNDNELSSLVSFIAASFYRDGSGRIEMLKSGKYGDSQFYEGVGDYFMLNTCNMWTAKGLQSTGMDISAMFRFSADGIMDYLEEMDAAALQRCME